MRRNVFYLFVTALLVSVGINILAHLKDFITFLPESAVLGPQVPYSQTRNGDNSDNKYRDGRYSDRREQARRYSYQDRWEDSVEQENQYRRDRIKRGRYD